MPERKNERNFAAAESTLQSTPTAHADGNHTEVLLAILAAVAAHDYPSLQGLLTEDVTLHIHGFPELDGSWIGRNDVIEAMETNFGKLTEQTPQLETVITQGNSVVVRIRETGRFTTTGEEYSVHGIVWYKFEAGRLKLVEEFLAVN